MLYSWPINFFIGYANIWPQISEGFHESPMVNIGIYVLLGVFGLILVISIGYIAAGRLQQKNQEQDRKFFRVSSPSTIYEILDTAWAQNSRMELHFHSQGKHLPCLYRELSRDRILIEPPQHIKINKSWIGRNVVIFFCVKLEKEARIYYKFNSTITDFFLQDENPVIQLSFPDKLDMEQKRKHLRLEIPSSYLKSLQVWPVFLQQDGSLPTKPAFLGEPLAAYDYSDPPKLKLMDLSGGGIKIGVSRKIISPVEEFIKKNPGLILRLQLREKPDTDEGAKTFYLLARIKNHFDDGYGYYLLGMEYEQYGRLDPETSEFLEWVKVDPEQGIEELVSWVIQKHLQFFREKGLV